MGMTMVEKILARATDRDTVKAGDVVEPKVDLAMSHENGALVLNQFCEIYKDTGLEAHVWDPSKIAIIFDHRVPAESSKTATNQKILREFVGEQSITKFHDVRGERQVDPAVQPATGVAALRVAADAHQKGSCQGDGKRHAQVAWTRGDAMGSVIHLGASYGLGLA